ncbi:MAG TPA: putative porin, partial [Candidatus Ratteibacteria bacterium]|nr:putative porin [Candidatus Ratteibacteria bacterium]
NTASSALIDQEKNKKASREEGLLDKDEYKNKSLEKTTKKGGKMKRKVLLAGIVCFLSFLVSSFASDVDLLIQKLVEKGILTSGEAQTILVETQEEVRKEEAKEREVPKWLDTMKFSGDARLRYEMEDKDPVDRHRGRIRLRYGFETKPNENTEIGVRVATGSSDQKSTNQTLEDVFSSKNIWLDKAYIKYSFNKYISIFGGKFSNPFINTDLVWDGDITPEGIAFQTKFPVGVFINGGFFPLQEDGGWESDPYMTGIQVGYSGKIASRDFKIAVAYYMTEGIEGRTTASVVGAGSAGTGNTIIGGNYIAEYKPIDVVFEFYPFEIQGVPVKLYADYVKNTESEFDKDTGYEIGFTVGKAKKKGTWEFDYNYRDIERDCVPAFLNDSDFNGGGTGSKGHKFGVKYAINDNSTAGITYIVGEGNYVGRGDVNTLQIDYVVNF